MQIFMRFFYAFCHFCIFLTFLGVKLCIKEDENVIFCKQIVRNILQSVRCDILNTLEHFLPGEGAVVIEHGFAHCKDIILLILRRDSHLTV